jgi:AcrR family transcriptional regulator
LAQGAKRSAIAEAALRLFLQEGFTATSVDMIAREAKVSKPTIYSHFPDKNALFEWVFVNGVELLASAWPIPKLGEGAPRRQLVRFAIHCVNHWNDDTVVALIRLAIAEVNRFPGIGSRVQGRLLRPLQIELVGFLKNVRRPNLDAARAETAAQGFLCELRAETLEPRLFGLGKAPTERRRREIAEAAAESFLRRLPGGEA